MDFETLLERRASVRSYDRRPVRASLIDTVLDAAVAAPSAGGLQAWEVVRVRDRRILADLADASGGQPCVEDAQVALVFFAVGKRSATKYGKRGAKLYAIQDATIAASFAHLRVADLGLGSVWVGAFDEAAVSRAVGAPEGMRPVAILPVGYPAQIPPRVRGLGREDLCHRDRF
jgi:nitroreductase